MTKVALPKNPSYRGYKLADEQSLRYGPAIALPEVMNFDESRMSIWLDYADGNRRDGVGDLLDIGGISLERHRPNPVVLFEHGKQKDWMLPVAMAEDRDSHEYTVVLNLPAKKACLNAFFYQGFGEKELVTKGYPNELREDKDKEYQWAWFCAQLYHMMINRYIRGGSIGYQTIQAEAIPPDYQRGIPAGQHLIKTLQLEGSVVVMPANMDTVRKSYSEFYDVVHKALCLPHCCGKPIHPYLVKSLTDCLPCGEKRMKAQLGWEPKGETEFVGDLQWLKDEQAETEHQKHLRKKYKAFSGKKKDKLGRQRCYSGGKPVPCGGNTQAAPAKPMSGLQRAGHIAGRVASHAAHAVGGGIVGTGAGFITGGVAGALTGGAAGAITGGVTRNQGAAALAGAGTGLVTSLAGGNRRLGEEFQHAAGHNMARNAEKAKKQGEQRVHDKKVKEGRVQLIGLKPQNIIKGKPGNISIKPTKSIKSLRTKYKSVGGVVGGAIGGVVGGVAGTVGGAYAGMKIHKKNPIVGAAVGSQAGGVAGMAGGAAVGAHIGHAISSMGSKKPVAPAKSPGAPGKKGIIGNAGKLIGGTIGTIGGAVAGATAGGIAGGLAGGYAGSKLGGLGGSVLENVGKRKGKSLKFHPEEDDYQSIEGMDGKAIPDVSKLHWKQVARNKWQATAMVSNTLKSVFDIMKTEGEEEYNLMIVKSNKPSGGLVWDNFPTLNLAMEEASRLWRSNLHESVRREKTLPNQHVKSLRIKYRSSVKRLRRRLKSSSPGSSVIYIRHKDLHNLQKLAGERGLKLQHMAQDAKTHKIKLTGDDGVIDQLAKNYGLSLPGAHTKRI